MSKGDVLQTAIIQALSLLKLEGLSTRGQMARKILEEGLANYAAERSAEVDRKDLSEGQLK